MTSSRDFLFTSESVTEGHPDKLADQISDAILDAFLEQDPHARVACETFVNTGIVVIGGEVTTTGYVDVQRLVRDTVIDVGYRDSSSGFDGATCGVLVALDEQSADIAQGVDRALESRESGDDHGGAGDQGMMFGYACDETDELMPLPITLAHRLTRRLAQVRHDGVLPWLRPDGKAQVSVRYVDGEPRSVETVVVSTQHAASHDGVRIDTDAVIRPAIIEHVIKPVLGELYRDDVTVYVNPTGQFVEGGPRADAGLTGRKIIVDTYGGSARHGGGAFSGKDPTKVDRSAAYAARYVAKHVVAAGLARRCEMQIAYAIGVARPVSLHVDTFGTGTISDDAILQAIERTFDLRPSSIIADLGLRAPIYRQTAAYGHFGRPDLDLPWERLDRIDQLTAAAGTTRSDDRVVAGA